MEWTSHLHMNAMFKTPLRLLFPHRLVPIPAFRWAKHLLYKHFTVNSRSSVVLSRCSICYGSAACFSFGLTASACFLIFTKGDVKYLGEPRHRSIHARPTFPSYLFFICLNLCGTDLEMPVPGEEFNACFAAPRCRCVSANPLEYRVCDGCVACR